MKRWLKDKKGFETETIAKWLIVLAVGIIVIVGMYYLYEEFPGMWQSIKNLFTFGR